LQNFLIAPHKSDNTCEVVAKSWKMAKSEFGMKCPYFCGKLKPNPVISEKGTIF